MAAKTMLATEIWFGVMPLRERNDATRFDQPVFRAAIGRRASCSVMFWSPSSATVQTNKYTRM